MYRDWNQAAAIFWSKECAAKACMPNWKGDGCLLATASVPAVFSLGRGTLTLAYEWWEPGKFSVQANVANGNALAFLPRAAVFHLIAETLHGKVANDFDERNDRRAEEISKVDTLVHGGGEAVIKLQVTEGNIKVMRANP